MTDQLTDANSTTNGSGNPVTPAGGGTAPANAAADPGSELNALIEDFNKGTAQTDTLRNFSKIIKAWDNKLEPVVQGYHQDAREKANAKAQEDVKSAISNIKKEAGAPDTYPDRIVAGYLHRKCNEDPAALDAWNKRLENPAAWTAVQAIVKGEVAEDLATYPTNTVRVVSDEERAVASVRNVSTEPPRADARNPVLDLRLSDQEWEKVQASELAKQRTG